MSERPILFSAPMVRALLAGTKLQTRRALRRQPPSNTVQVSTYHHPDTRPHFYAWVRAGAPDQSHPFGGAEISSWEPVPCPYGAPGDRLWVREAWAVPHRYDHLGPSNIPVRGVPTHYAATEDRGGLRWRPSIHMCRWASRITLELTGVRVERLQDISETDSIDEGVLSMGQQWEGDTFPDYFEALGVAVSNGEKPPIGPSPRERYARLWDQINGAGAWAANPWVWVVAFRRV